MKLEVLASLLRGGGGGNTFACGTHSQRHLVRLNSLPAIIKYLNSGKNNKIRRNLVLHAYCLFKVSEIVFLYLIGLTSGLGWEGPILPPEGFAFFFYPVRLDYKIFYMKI